MAQYSDRIGYLRGKAAALPRRPGVYIMKDAGGRVIYVGKSRTLRDRVSQYFHLPEGQADKTARMAGSVADFDFILCDTEIEALSLENALIKQHSPKYNIKLKDAKSYPYIKVSVNEPYPRIGMTRKRLADGARYFGPYSGTNIVYEIIATLERTLGIPNCKRVFPRDIGRERPCVYAQLGRCVAPCTGKVTQEEYNELIRCAISILRGNTREAVRSLEQRMIMCAEEEKYEEAARCRDSIEALKRLGDKQKVVGSPDAEFDIIALWRDDVCACASVFYIRSGVITDSEEFYFGADEIVDFGASDMKTADAQTDSAAAQTGETAAAAPDAAVPAASADAGASDTDGGDADNDVSGDDVPDTVSASSFITSLYSRREDIPPEILLSFPLPQQERDALGEYLRGMAGHKVTLRTPVRGDNKALCDMARDNARQKAAEHRRRAENDERVLIRLAQMLSLPSVPQRIEAYDISNLGSEHITAGMIVAKNGRLAKSDYRVFRIKGQTAEDDYAAMREAVSRRFAHLSDTDGSFSELPDLILLDGGKGHVSVVSALLDELGLPVPVFGMVKDEHHKTRSVVGVDGDVSIARDNEVFIFVYRLQEEVHRFTVSKMTGAKRKTIKTSSLEKIKGIGAVKARLLLSHFGTLAAVRAASEDELARVRGVSRTDAKTLRAYFDAAAAKTSREAVADGSDDEDFGADAADFESGDDNIDAGDVDADADIDADSGEADD